MSNTSRSGLVALAIAAIIGLLCFSGYLLWKNKNLQQVSENQSMQIDESEKLKAELEKQYYESLSELEEMRGNNDELNALIEKQKDELKEKKNQIYRLLKSKNALADARTEMTAMRVQLDQYVSELNQLKQQNVELTAKTVKLEKNNESLRNDLTSKIEENTQLETARATLVSEKETLTTKAVSLGEKVSVASVVKISNVEVTGWKIKNNGKAVKKKYAKNIERLEMCFSTIDNTVVPAGEENFFIRIINPLGETLAVEELGSGELTEKLNDQPIRYTKTATIDYQNDRGDFCTTWEPNLSFSKGNYSVEIYNKGYLAGTGEFMLK